MPLTEQEECSRDRLFSERIVDLLTGDEQLFDRIDAGVEGTGEPVVAGLQRDFRHLAVRYVAHDAEVQHVGGDHPVVDDVGALAGQPQRWQDAVARLLQPLPDRFVNGRSALVAFAGGAVVAALTLWAGA